MTRFFPKLYIDLSSFWAGIILVVLLLVIFFIYRKRLRSFFSRALTAIVNFRESLSITSDADYIQVLYKFIQGLHVYADFYPLESILVPARCIAPPPYLFPGKKSLDTSLIQQVVGYDPLLPQLNSEYFGPTFSLLDAVQSGSNLCLVGFPGSGKTAAIAECIAGLIKYDDPEGEIEPKIPFYVKAHDLLAQFPGQDMLGILLKALELNKSFLAIPNFPRYLTNAIKSHHSVLFLDDIDNLAIDDVNRLANFITALRTQIPELQIVATATPSCLGSLVKAPIEFLSIHPWGDKEKYQFLEKFSTLWPSIQPLESSEDSEGFSVMNSMLVVSGQNLTPLEFTLKTMAAYSGDLNGPTGIDGLDAHIARTASISDEDFLGLEVIAVYCLDANNSLFTRRELSTWFSDVYKKENPNPAAIRSISFQSVIQAALDQKFLQAVPENSFYFKHPTFAGLFAARGLAKASPQLTLRILERPGWGPLHDCMRYFPAFNDIKPFLKPLLIDQSLLKNKLLRASQWLEYAPANSPEETALLKQITREIHTNPFYLVKLRLISALSRSGNAQVKAIFQHLLKSDNLDTRRAAAVGLGLLQDLSAVPSLINQLNDAYPSSTAACYALGKIGSPRSLEAIAEALLHGSEYLRRSAAEALAQNRSEGHPALREGSSMDDLLVRYAVVHGLSMINESWALEILDKMRIDEKEWIVRDLAQQTYEILETVSPYLPQDTPFPHETSWLHKFAEQQDLPQPTAENALDLLLEALNTGTVEQKQNALAHIARTGKEELIPTLLDLASVQAFDVAHQALLSIWLCAPQRVEIPS